VVEPARDEHCQGSHHDHCCHGAQGTGSAYVPRHGGIRPASAHLRLRQGKGAWHRHAGQSTQHSHRLAQAHQFGAAVSAGMQVLLNAHALLTACLVIQIIREQLGADVGTPRFPER
jgi:hypothetical protein